ncbi:hypothetical protein OROMI_007814 [Orobanche minor]
MADCSIIGSASIISYSFENPKHISPVICEISTQKKPSVDPSHPKNSSGTVSLLHNTEKNVEDSESLAGKSKPAISDAVIALSNHRSTETTEDSSKKIYTGTRSGVSSAPVVPRDLGCFIFPEAVKDVSSKITSGRVSSPGGSALESSGPKVDPEVLPKSSGSFATFEAIAGKINVSAKTGSDPVDLLKGSASSVNPVVNPPVANNSSAHILEGSSSASGFSVKPLCAADLRRAVSPEVWARFLEAVWNDAAVIASEILKLPPPAGSAGTPLHSVGQGMDPLIPPNNFSPDAVLTGASFVPPVPPVGKPVTPSDSSANGSDPEAPTFAALVSNKNVVVERIDSTDFSGPLPTAVFTKEECENVSAVYKNALIGKFSFGKPDNFAIANYLFNNGLGKWFPMRLFKWDPFFDFKQEPALVPIWVKIMALPLQWFDLGSLQTIGSLVGTFLKADPMTINRSRLDDARICVEVNLKNSSPKSAGISCGTIFKEFEVEYEKLPSFCHHCQHIGHSIDACYIKNPSLKPQTFTKKFLNMDNLQPKERDRSVWYTVGKGKKVVETSVSGVKNNEVGLPPPPDTNGFVKNAGALSDNGTLVVNNGFAALESLDEEELRPPPAGSNVVSEEIGSQGHVRTGLASPISQHAHKNKGSVTPEPEVNVFSAIPPQNPPPPFVLGDCNLSGAGDVPVLFNFRSSGGDKKGSSGPKTHRGSHQDSLKNLNELVLSSSDDDREQTDDKAHQDGAMYDPSFNASSNCSGAEGDPPDSGSPRILMLLLFGFDKVISNVNHHIWIFSDVGTDVSVLFDSDQLLHTKVVCNDLPNPFLLSVVYGKNNKIERRTLWNDLVSVSQNITPWMVGGDFNIVLYPHEKKGDNPPILSEMEEFRDAILECNLMDGGYVGPPFTWYSNFIWQRVAEAEERFDSDPNTTNMIHLKK